MVFNSLDRLVFDKTDSKDDSDDDDGDGDGDEDGEDSDNEDEEDEQDLSDLDDVLSASLSGVMPTHTPTLHPCLCSRTRPRHTRAYAHVNIHAHTQVGMQMVCRTFPTWSLPAG